ncbi:MAG: GNAT family protein [Bacteroidota bacterium]
MQQILLRYLTLDDLEGYQKWKAPHHTYHQLNGPYYSKPSLDEIQQLIDRLRVILQTPTDDPTPGRMLISNPQNELLGEVNWYWKSQETNWLEVGLLLFDEANWGKGIGSQALPLWIDHVFQSKPELVRIGLSTWSGNTGMIRLAEKLQLKKEAEYRKARIVNNEYFDSISYGLLREEWERLRS